MFKIIKENLTKTTGEMMKNDEQEFEDRFEDMVKSYRNLVPLIREVRVLKLIKEQISSDVFDNTIKIDSIEKKVNKIIEYLEKEQKKKK